MIFYAQETQQDVFVRLMPGQSIVVGNVTHPWQIMELWSAPELAAIGLYRLSVDVPTGRSVSDITIARVGNDVVATPVLVPISERDVIAERARRLAAGFNYDFGDDRGVHRIGTTDQDMIGWREVTDLANAYVAAGDTTSTIAIVTDTGPVVVTAMEWQAILVAAGAFRQPIWTASFVIQAMDPIPDDYADNSRWP